MRVEILGRRWNLVYRRLRDNRGECDPPEQCKKEIRVANDLRGQEELEVLLHEMVHAAGWHLDEEYVQKFADDVSQVLWRLGYRKLPGMEVEH